MILQCATLSVEFNLQKDNVVEAEDPTSASIIGHAPHRLRPESVAQPSPLSTPPEDGAGGAGSAAPRRFSGSGGVFGSTSLAQFSPFGFANALLDFSPWGISRRKGLADRAVGRKYKMPLPALSSRSFPNIAQLLSLKRKHARVPPSPRRKDPPCCPQER
jgi:hypothetical protein